MSVSVKNGHVITVRYLITYLWFLRLSQSQPVCAAGRFGVNCAHECHCANPLEFCQPNNGACTSGCDHRRMGPTCQGRCYNICCSFSLWISFYVCWNTCLSLISMSWFISFIQIIESSEGTSAHSNRLFQDCFIYSVFTIDISQSCIIASMQLWKKGAQHLCIVY